MPVEKNSGATSRRAPASALPSARHRDHASLAPHPVLGKWLYLPETCETFEADARRLVQLAKAHDPRLGIPPSPRKKRAAKRIRFGDKL